jgi:putative transposase
MRKWLAQLGVETLYVEPDSPWENGYVESFRSRLWDEFLALDEFEGLAVARKLTAMCKEDHNRRRPNVRTGTLLTASTRHIRNKLRIWPMAHQMQLMA